MLLAPSQSSTPWRALNATAWRRGSAAALCIWLVAGIALWLPVATELCLDAERLKIGQELWLQELLLFAARADDVSLEDSSESADASDVSVEDSSASHFRSPRACCSTLACDFIFTRLASSIGPVSEASSSRRLFLSETCAFPMASPTLATSAAPSTSILLFRDALAAHALESTFGASLAPLLAGLSPLSAFGWLVAAGAAAGCPPAGLARPSGDDGAGEEPAGGFESPGGSPNGGHEGSP